jgi:hypothetical protein
VDGMRQGRQQEKYSEKSAGYEIGAKARAVV